MRKAAVAVLLSYLLASAGLVFMEYSCRDTGERGAALAGRVAAGECLATGGCADDCAATGAEDGCCEVGAHQHASADQIVSAQRPSGAATAVASAAAPVEPRLASVTVALAATLRVPPPHHRGFTLPLII